MLDIIRDTFKWWISLWRTIIPQSSRKKIPTITIFEILHTFISMDIHIWPTYPETFCPNFFFGKSMAQKYPTYLQFGHMFKLLYFFGPFPCWVTLTCRIHLNVINITPGSTYRFKVHIQWFNFHFNILTTNAQDQCPGLMFRIYLAFFR